MTTVPHAIHAHHPAAVASVSPSVARRIASTHCSLLLTGETGVGKGYFARWVHDHGPRSARPFVPVNCGALPEGILDSQLFGHAKGAFSDAHREHAGLVRAAEGGTLFLDEVGELPPAGQLRLLRLLEEREVQPVGATAPIRVDVRIIAATGRDLAAMVAERRFREDLYYRLNVIHLDLMPLRERRSEVRELAHRFAHEFADRFDRPALEFDAEAWKHLRRFGWPGNVRQLRSLIERMSVLWGDEPVTVEGLHEVGRLPRPTEAPRRSHRFQVWEARRAAARTALERAGGNVSSAAVELGVHRSTIHRWLNANPALTA